MLFKFDILVLLSIVLVWLRLAVLFYLTPLDGMGRVPRRVSLLFLVALSAVLVVSLGIVIPENSLSLGSLLLGALTELCNGLAMVLGVYVAFGAYMVAGQLIDAQTGFAAAMVLNPTTNVQEPIMGTLLQLLAVALFFLMGMHHLFIQGIAYSFEMVPLGSLINSELWPQVFLGAGAMFSFGVILAAPVLAGLLLLDAGVAMMSRTMPQMNIYFVMLPLKIFVGLLLLVFTLKYMVPLFETIFMSIFRQWQSLM